MVSRKKSRPLNTALLEECQWAMEALSIVYRGILQETTVPKQQQALFSSQYRIRLYMMGLDRTDSTQLRAMIDKLNQAISNYRATGQRVPSDN